MYPFFSSVLRNDFRLSACCLRDSSMNGSPTARDGGLENVPSNPLFGPGIMKLLPLRGSGPAAPDLFKPYGSPTHSGAVSPSIPFRGAPYALRLSRMAVSYILRCRAVV